MTTQSAAVLAVLGEVAGLLRRGSFAAGLDCQRFVEPPTIRKPE
jgi:hypothetical protein